MLLEVDLAAVGNVISQFPMAPKRLAQDGVIRLLGHGGLAAGVKRGHVPSQHPEKGQTMGVNKGLDHLVVLEVPLLEIQLFTS